MQKTVLVADDDFDVTQSLTRRLKQLGLLVLRSPDATHALLGAQRMRPDLIILDVNMPGGNGLAVAEMLATDSAFRDLPVIIYTGQDDELTRIRCLHTSHYYVRKSPHSWNEIKEIVCKVLGIKGGDAQAEDDVTSIDSPAAAAAPPIQDQEPAPPTQSPASDEVIRQAPPEDGTEHGAKQQPHERKGDTKRGTVLCIDDDPDFSEGLKIRLASYGVEVQRAFNGMEGYWTAVDEQPDVIICDMVMPEGDGSYIFSRLKDHPLTEAIPFIVLTGQGNPAKKRTMMSLGAAAYLSKPVVFDDLLRELRAFLDLPEQPDRAERGRALGVQGGAARARPTMETLQ